MSSVTFPPTIEVSLHDLAKMIDHSLLHPTMTDEILAEGYAISKKYDVATACIKPYAIPQAVAALKGTDVKICPVIGFPQGNSTTEVKVFEARRAAEEGGQEIDMVINIGKALGGQWDYVKNEIKAVNDAVVAAGAISKIIFENDFLTEKEIIKLCHICSELDVAFVKTSTGYGMVKQADGSYNYKGATYEHLKLMRDNCKPSVQIKAAGGVRTLDDMLRVRSLGVSRIGATATGAILEEAKSRGIGAKRVTVKVQSL